ncbi:hypothetical protein ACHAXS_009498 [Conticribra weissflogii]
MLLGVIKDVKLMKNIKEGDAYEDAPLPLTKLRTIISHQTYLWLEEADAKESEWKAQLEEERSNAIDLFESSRDDDEYGDCERRKYDDFESRVREWTSSHLNSDGFGGISIGDDDDSDENNGKNHGEQLNVENKQHPEDGSITVKYILSEAPGGHGDAIWAASRHVANLFADVRKCRDLLSPILNQNDDVVPYSRNDHIDDGVRDRNANPLKGKKVIELGAGAGIPSWSALHCGADLVVCTDQAIADRIRCLAECALRNLEDIQKKKKQSAQSEGKECNSKNYVDGGIVKVCPYGWGSPIDPILETIRFGNNPQRERDLEQDRLFDVVIAADCIYMPDFHEPLLKSIKLLIHRPKESGHNCGMALLPFALHGNTKDENVWNIVPLAREMGFEVEVLDGVQLTPQWKTMDRKRGFVNMLRLTLQDSS